jgi:hypothetical protein
MSNQNQKKKKIDYRTKTIATNLLFEMMENREAIAKEALTTHDVTNQWFILLNIWI